MALYLIRYGELGLKSRPVRRRFESALIKNITKRFVQLGKECRIESDWGRIMLWCDEPDVAEKILEKTFGVVSFSRTVECSAVKEDIYKLAADESKQLFKMNMSFAVRARRMGQHKYTSMEIAKEAGSAVFMANEHLKPKVNLTKPDLEIFIEVRQNRAFVFSKIIQGQGGMPVGTQGKIVGLAENERDMAACWMMLKRGCRVLLVSKNDLLAKTLERWDPMQKLLELEGKTTISDMVRMCAETNAEGIALGWDLATIEKRASEVTGLPVPVFYPLAGLTDGQLEELLRTIRG
jgi:thiamine biosynthesis protein ThiI